MVEKVGDIHIAGRIDCRGGGIREAGGNAGSVCETLARQIPCEMRRGVGVIVIDSCAGLVNCELNA